MRFSLSISYFPSRVSPISASSLSSKASSVRSPDSTRTKVSRSAPPICPANSLQADKGINCTSSELSTVAYSSRSTGVCMVQAITGSSAMEVPASASAAPAACPAFCSITVSIPSRT